MASEHALREPSIVVVTGAAGYVGSWLVTLLLQRGHTVRACVRDVANARKTAYLRSHPEYHPNDGAGRLSLHSADMTQPGAYDDVFRGAHTVFHPAEVFMSFSLGRDRKAARQDFNKGKAEGVRITGDALHGDAMRTAAHLVSSIEQSGSVRRLVYTSSIAAMMPGPMAAFAANPAVDETRQADASFLGATSYGPMKRQTELFYSHAAAASGGRWSVVIANPGDVIGPILSAHQAGETWQGKIGSILQGVAVPQEAMDRPWNTVDVRDVAEAEVRLAESDTVESGSRFLLASGDKVRVGEVAGRILDLGGHWADVAVATTVLPPPGAKAPVSSDPLWMRVHTRADSVQQAVGLRFKPWNDTLRDTLQSLVDVGGAKIQTRRVPAPPSGANTAGHKLKLYTAPGTPNPNVVMMYLNEAGASASDLVDTVPVNLAKGENREPAFMAVNPLGEVPALVLPDGTCLSESVAIAQYIDDVHTRGEGSALCGRTAFERAETAMWIRRMDDKLLDPMGAAFRSGPMRKFFEGRRPGYVHAEVVGPSIEGALAGLQWFNAQLGDGRRFLCGDRFTLADIRLFCVYSFFLRGDKAQSALHKERRCAHFEAYITRIAERHSAQALKPKKKQKQKSTPASKL